MDGTAGTTTTRQLVIPLARDRRQGGGEIVAGLDGTVRAALLDVGLVGWTVPALAMSVPGLLVVIVVALQLVGGAAWIPVARRILSRANPSPRARRR